MNLNTKKKKQATEQFIKLLFEESYELLSEYKGALKKVKIRCNKGHEYSVTPNSFKTGYRCPKCSNKCPIQAKEQFIELLDQEGYKLLSKYINIKTKVKIRCNKGHEYSSATPNDFKKGNRCPKCSNKCPIQAKEQFIELLAQEGYKPLSEYKGILKKIKIKCPKGHIYEVKPSSFKNGSRCPRCAGVCPIQAKEQFIELLKNENFFLLSDYKGSHQKVKLKCPKGHIYEVKPSSFKNGSKCPKCSKKCPIQAKEQFIELLAQEGYELLSEYKNIDTKVILRCPERHEWNTTPHSFKTNNRCPHCAGSTGQRKLQSMLEIRDLGSMVYNNRTILNGLELDIYYPELNIAIEYQGNYWHNKPDAIERDKRKRKLCEEKGIKLIEVWDNDFMKDPDLIIRKVVDEILTYM